MVLPKAVARNLLIPQEMCDDGGSWAYITEPIQDEWSDWVSCTLGLKRGEHYATSHSFAAASLPSAWVWPSCLLSHSIFTLDVFLRPVFPFFGTLLAVD